MFNLESLSRERDLPPRKKFEAVEDGSIPPESERYRNIKCLEVISDDEGIRDFAVTTDRQSVIYVSGKLNKKLKILDTGKKQIIKEFDEDPVSVRMFEEPQEAQLGQCFAYHLGTEFVVRDRKSFEEVYHAPAVSSSRSFETKDGKYFVAGVSGNDVEVYNLETGEDKMINEQESSDPCNVMKDISDGNVALACGKNIDVLNIGTGQYSHKLEGHSDGVFAICESGDGTKIISASADKTIKFWNKKTGQCVQTINFDVAIHDGAKIAEAIDKKHIIISYDDQVAVINSQTGQCVAVLEGDSFSQATNGVITVHNQDRLETWQTSVFKKSEAKPEEFVIRGDRVLTEEDRFNEYEIDRAEITEGANWFQYSNLEAKRLKEKKKFKWGDERIYFNIPLDQMEVLKDLAIKTAKELKIPIAFKYLDMASSKEDVAEAPTRFVANFISIRDAKEFMGQLSQSDEYAKMQSDREADYLAYNIDGKAHYASGYREIRESDYSKFLEMISKIAPNPDGTYTVPGAEGSKTITQSEYDELLKQGDFRLKFKNKWEETEE